MSVKNILDPKSSNLQDRVFRDYEALQETIRLVRQMGCSVSLVSGTWDLFHEGHAEYLAKAKSTGDILVVGVDSDAKVKKRKGPNRPVVSEDERVRILSHTRYADIIFLKGAEDEPRGLLKVVRPDVLIISESTKHEDGDVEQMKPHCGKIEIFPPQSTTSTTAKVRRFHIMGQEDLVAKIMPTLKVSLPLTLAPLIDQISNSVATEIGEILRKTIEGNGKDG